MRTAGPFSTREISLEAFCCGKCDWYEMRGVGSARKLCRWTLRLKVTALRRPTPGYRSTPPRAPHSPAGGKAVACGSEHHHFPFELWSGPPLSPRSDHVCRTCFLRSRSPSDACGTTPYACPVVAPCAKRVFDLGSCACDIVFGVGASCCARRIHHSRNIHTRLMF